MTSEKEEVKVGSVLVQLLHLFVNKNNCCLVLSYIEQPEDCKNKSPCQYTINVILCSTSDKTQTILKSKRTTLGKERGGGKIKVVPDIKIKIVVGIGF